MMKISKEVKNFGRAAVLGLYLGVAAWVAGTAVYIAAMPFQAAIEMLQDNKEQTLEAKLEKKGEVYMMQTKGVLFYGDFEIGDGKKIRVYDSWRITHGKIFFNTKIPKLEENNEYRLIITGSEKTGYCLLKATNEGK